MQPPYEAVSVLRTSTHPIEPDSLFSEKIVTPNRHGISSNYVDMF